jgi:hypothetical protein
VHDVVRAMIAVPDHGLRVAPAGEHDLVELVKENYYARCENRTAACGARHALRWSHRGNFSRRVVRAVKIKLLFTSRDACCKQKVKCLQRSGVSALYAPAAAAWVASVARSGTARSFSGF